MFGHNNCAANASQASISKNSQCASSVFEGETLGETDVLVVDVTVAVVCVIAVTVVVVVVVVVVVENVVCVDDDLVVDEVDVIPWPN